MGWYRGLFSFLFILMSAGLAIAAPVQALLFIDSGKVHHMEMVNVLNKDFTFSSTLSSHLSVLVIDVRGGLLPRYDALQYQVDSRDEWVNKYKPRSLPWLICSQDETSPTGMRVSRASDIRHCLKPDVLAVH